MAVTEQNSTQIANRVAVPPVMDHAADNGGRTRKKYFTFTQSGAGDATSIANLCHLPGGHVRVYKIVVKHSAFGTSRTGDLGHNAYTDNDEAAVAADPDAFSADTSIASAGTIVVYPLAQVISKAGFYLTLQCNDGTIPDGATLEGYAEYQND